MIHARSPFCFLTIGLLLFAHLHLWGATGCSMCGATCRCASHAAGDACTVRSVGCGGGESGTTLGSVSPLRAVIVTPLPVAPRFEFVSLRAPVVQRPSQPVRPPLDRPPRISC